MKSITLKIFIPIILVLLLVFSFLIFFVGKAVKGGIMTQFEKQSRIQVDSIYLTVDSLYRTELQRSSDLIDQTKNSLIQESEIAMDILTWFYHRHQQGILSESDAKKQAMDAVTSLIFGEEGYFYIVDRNYTMLAHPSPNVETGNSWKDVSDSSGQFYIRKLTDQAVSGGNGFLDYEFPKPGEDLPSPKLGYMVYFEPWGWALGTGKYMDFIENEKDRIHRDTIERLNQVLYRDIDATQAYPFIKNRDDIYIAYVKQDRVGDRAPSQDKITGEDLTEKYFAINNGPVSYNYTRSGEGDRIFKKMGYARVHKELDWVIVYTAYEDVIIKDVRKIILLLIISGLLTVLISGGLIIVILIVIAGKIKKAAAGFEKFASGSGDLTRRLEGKGGDEVGQLVGSFNRFLDKLQTIIGEIQDVALSSKEIGYSLNHDSSSISASLEQIVSNAGSIESSSLKLNNHSDLTGNALGDIFNAIEVVNNQIVEEAASVEESSASIEEMIASVSNIDRVSKERKVEVDRLTDMAGESSRQMDQTIQDISKIADSVDSIRDVISVINGISARINLLAMNAAIEAAHAGDAGKGFAVVADEVRKLAESTGENSKRISESIKSIIEDINSTQKKSQDTGQIIVKMEDSSRSVSRMISEVIAAISEVSSGNRQILEALGNLKDSSSAVKDSSSLVEDKARFAVQAVEEISGLSNQNYQGIKEIRSALDEIAGSVSHISDLGSRNSDNLERIDRQIGNFKVVEDKD